MQWLLSLSGLAVAAVMLASCGGSANGESASKELTVATRAGGLPYISAHGNNCTGIDCNVLKAVAAKLGLRLHFDVMSFQASLAAVQTGRDDLAIGGITWNPKRAKTGLFTDTVEYEPASVLQRPGSDIHTIAGLENKSVGTVTGFNAISGLQAIQGVSIHTYNTDDEVYADVSNGRLDAGFIGALEDRYIKKIRPDLHFVSVPLQITPAQIKQQPAYVVFRPHQNAFYLNKAEGGLERKLTCAIDHLYSTGEIRKLVTGYGVSDSTPFVTAPAGLSTARVGVDRPQGWVAPTLGYKITQGIC